MIVGKRLRKLIYCGKVAASCIAFVYLASGAKAVFAESERIGEAASDFSNFPYDHVIAVKKIEEEPVSRIFEDRQLIGFQEYQIPEEFEAEGGELPYELQEHIYKLCEDYGVDYALILAMIEIESAYQKDAVSSCNAIGYMQVIEKWNVDRMERLGVDDLYDPYSNIAVGIDCIAELSEKYPVEAALGVYNMGTKAADLWKEGVTTRYSDKVMKRYQEITKEFGAL